jgi:hypothetical protein
MNPQHEWFQRAPRRERYDVGQTVRLTQERHGQRVGVITGGWQNPDDFNEWWYAVDIGGLIVPVPRYKIAGVIDEQGRAA